MKATTGASGAGKYVYISSNTYPRLLDLMGQSVSFYCWANPVVDDDAFIEIFTLAGIKEGEYTADSGTSATEIVDSELESSVDDYYNGDYVWNSTRSLGALVTDYDGGTKTLTVAIASQTNGDIYYIRTTQTLTSTTANPAGRLTLLKLEDQELNDDLVEVQIRFKVTTASQSVYFDHARVIGRNQREYLLPLDVANGKLSSVEVQTDTYSDRGCDDLLPRGWEDWNGWEIIDDGTDKFLDLGMLPIEERLIRLRGYAPLSAVSIYSDTIEIDGELLNRFIAYAKYKLYQAIEGPVAASDIGRYELQSAKAYQEYQRLSHLRMSVPKVAMRIRQYNK